MQTAARRAPFALGIGVPKRKPLFTPHNLASLLSLFTEVSTHHPLVKILRGRLFLTSTPVEVDLLSESDRGVIIADGARSGAVCAGERNTVVDVENAARATGGVDVAGSWDLVGLGVDLALGPDTATGDGCLCGGRGRRVLAEVVGAVKGTSDALVELSISVICALDNGELEATGILRAAVVSNLQVCGLETLLTLRFRWSWQFLVFSEGLTPGPM